MPAIDLVDDTFVVAAPELVAREIADPARWCQWWPDLRLTVATDRGRQGLRWQVEGALVGTCELWLEPVGDGVVVHYYLRAEPAAGPLDVCTPRGARQAARHRAVRARAWKRQVFALKDRLEGDRRPGVPR